MARHILYFNFFDLPALNAQGATSPRLKAAPWNDSYRINGVVYAPSRSDDEYDNYEEYSEEESEILDNCSVEYLTSHGWKDQPMWSRF